MTHKDILTKFMIEYDKANITSSYPSLTNFEIATILDKAYLALIAQKLTGVNQRKVPFEYDTKAIEDIRPLVTTKKSLQKHLLDPSILADNELIFGIPNDPQFLYYIHSKLDKSNVILVNHEVANTYKETDVNYPWIKNPVCYLQGNDIHVLIDPDKIDDQQVLSLVVTYILKPNKFVGPGETTDFGDTTFLLSDTMAEELINLAIVMALETVESSRLTSKTSLLSLES